MALAFLRRHRSWFNWFLVAIILSFIFLYIPTNEDADARSGGAVVAEVGGEPITMAEYDRQYQAQRARLQNAYQGRLDEEMVRRMGLRAQTLQDLIDQRVLTLEARRLGLRVDDQTVAKRLVALPQFSRDGRFVGAQEFRRRLDLMGVTEKEVTESLRDGLLQEKLMSLVTAGVSVGPAEAEREFRRRNEQVKAEYVLVPASVADVSATDEEAKAHLASRADQYRLPERRVVSYLLLDNAALLPRVTATDRETEAYYETHTEEFAQPEEVCAKHILVKVKANREGEGHSDEEARRLAQAALDQARKGADFAAVAAKVSEDQGSATRGGDLGCFGRGRMVPEFEQAAFALKPGEVSDLVKTNFGYHVLRVESRKEASAPPLAEVKETIRKNILTQKVRDLLEEKATAISEALGKGSSLADVGREQGLTVQKSAPLAQGDAAPPLNSPTLVSRAFEIKRGQVDPEPFPVAAGYAFIGLEEIQAPRVPELKDVQDKVKADVLLEKALEKARARAAELKSVAARDGLEKAASALGLVRKETAGLVARGQPFGDLGTAATLDEAAFNLETGALSEPVRLPRGYAVVRLLEKKPFDPAAFAREKDSLVGSLTDERREQMFRAYLQEARKRFPVEKRADVLRRATAG